MLLVYNILPFYSVLILTLQHIRNFPCLILDKLIVYCTVTVLRLREGKKEKNRNLKKAV